MSPLVLLLLWPLILTPFAYLLRRRPWVLSPFFLIHAAGLLWWGRGLQLGQTAVLPGLRLQVTPLTQAGAPLLAVTAFLAPLLWLLTPRRDPWFPLLFFLAHGAGTLLLLNDDLRVQALILASMGVLWPLLALDPPEDLPPAHHLSRFSGWILRWAAYGMGGGALFLAVILLESYRTAGQLVLTPLKAALALLTLGVAVRLALPPLHHGAVRTWTQAGPSGRFWPLTWEGIFLTVFLFLTLIQIPDWLVLPAEGRAILLVTGSLLAGLLGLGAWSTPRLERRAFYGAALLGISRLLALTTLSRLGSVAVYGVLWGDLIALAALSLGPKGRGGWRLLQTFLILQPPPLAGGLPRAAFFLSLGGISPFFLVGPLLGWIGWTWGWIRSEEERPLGRGERALLLLLLLLSLAVGAVPQLFLRPLRQLLPLLPFRAG